MQTAEILNDILRELERAEKLHPAWPKDIIHQIAIMNEEAGESTQAALNHFYHGQTIEKVRKEVIHCGAMCIRVLKNLEEANGHTISE